MTSSPVPLAVGSFSPSVLLRVADRTGVLAAHGVAVREVAATSSPAQFRALEDGSLDVALTSPDNVVAYRFLPGNPLGSTRDVRIVAGVDRGMGLALYARPGTASVADLRGAVLGVDVTASGFALALFEILAASGLTAGVDYELVELGSTPMRLTALLEGRCAATMLNAGNDLRADDAGLVRLAGVTEVAAPYLGTVLAVQGEPTPNVRSLAAALRETAAEILSGHAREAALAETAATGLPAHLAERYVDALADPDGGLVADLAVDRAALESVIDLRRRHMTGGFDASSSSDSLAEAIDPLADATEPGSGLVDEARS